MAGGFDDFEMDDLTDDKLENIDDDQLNNYFNQISEERDRLYNKYYDCKKDSGKGRVRYEEYDEKLNLIEEERNRRSRDVDLFTDGETGRSHRNYGKTSWIDDDMDYKEADLTAVRIQGKKDNLSEFINDLISKKGEVNRSVTEDQRAEAMKFLRSYLAISDGEGRRPLLNNRNGLEMSRLIG